MIPEGLLNTRQVCQRLGISRPTWSKKKVPPDFIPNGPDGKPSRTGPFFWSVDTIERIEAGQYGTGE